MNSFEHPTFTTAEIADILKFTADYKARGFYFVQICATTLEDSCELLYAFTDPSRAEVGMTGVVVNVPDGAAVPSITDYYPAAFVFENETHDLFGIDVQGINIDFKGAFYQVPVAYPMNPRAASQTEGTEEGEETDDE